MYKNNFVATLSSNNKFFKDEGGCFLIPFDTQYSIFLKNLQRRNASVKISIDGQDVLDGKSIVVFGNSSVTLDGFLKGDMISNKFKFIRRSKKIEAYRGINPEDGLVVITFDFEEEVPETKKFTYKVTYTQPLTPPYTWTTFSTSNFFPTGGTSTISTHSNSSQPVSSENYGITVAGEDIGKPINSFWLAELENKPSTIVLRLIGTDEKNNQKTMYTREKKICPTCGTKNRNHHAFCFECGTRIK